MMTIKCIFSFSARRVLLLSLCVICFTDIYGQANKNSQKVKVAAESAVTSSRFIKMKLPLGQVFETWEKDFQPKKIYHVAQNAKNASDANDGSEKAPFKTISKAASILGTNFS